ncbi:hypothetical protein K1719_018084 [Acacia pycnantha]|nr:hypothetical protein K1719_018084 [Acacia pycnantha]
MSMFWNYFEMLSRDADIPSSFYDCMLYWGEDDRRETCKKCHTSRFKTVRKGKKQKKKPAKILSLLAHSKMMDVSVERFLGKLKSYVRNKAWLERSIAKVISGMRSCIFVPVLR